MLQCLTDDECQRLAERFWLEVFVCPYDMGCWIWTGGTQKPNPSRLPYGVLQVKLRGSEPRVNIHVPAHRLSWAMHFGPIPEGKRILHSCDNAKCVRPEHLWVGTDADNHADMVFKRRIPFGERHVNHVATCEEVTQIRSEVSAGSRQIALARRFKLSKQCVSDIVNRKTWDWL
jgi:hypothetical protein